MVRYLRNKDSWRFWVMLFVISMIFVSPVQAYYAMPESDTISADYEQTEYSIYRLLKLAMQPVGNTMYIWGGGWNEEDTAAGIEAVTLGVSKQWGNYCQLQNANYDYSKTRYQIHNGLDCSGYVGWTIYNLLHTINGVEGEGYVMKAKKMAKAFADKGWGEYTPVGKIKDYKAGDIMSSKTHVYFILGACQDGSIVLVHASPPGVQINGTVNRRGSVKSEAAELADYYMSKYYPQWYRRYKPEVKDFSYLSQYSQMRWKTGGNFWMKDEEGLQQMSAGEVLKAVLGE